MTYASVGFGLDVPTPAGPQSMDPTKSYCGSLIGLKQMLKDLGYYKGDVLSGGQQSAKDAIAKFAAERGFDPFVTTSFCTALTAAWQSKPKKTIAGGKILGVLFRPAAPTAPTSPSAPTAPAAPAAPPPSAPAPATPGPPPAAPPPLLNEPPIAPETPYAPVTPPPESQEPVVVGTGTTAVFPMNFAIAAAALVAIALIFRKRSP
jgi:hypothetical protein